MSTNVTTESSAPSIAQPTAAASGASTTAAQTPAAPTTSPATSVPEDEPTDTEPSTAQAPAEIRTFVAAHGSITVRLDNGQLALVGQNADDGYAFQLDRNDPDRIRVRFRSDQATSQIDVFIAGGLIAGTIEEQSSSPAGVAPSNTTDDSTSDGPGHN